MQKPKVTIKRKQTFKLFFKKKNKINNKYIISFLETNRRAKFNNSYWKNIDNVKSALLPICEELGRFPTTIEIQAKGYRYLYKAICRWYGGIKNIAEAMGYESSRHSNKPYGYWVNLDNVNLELLKYYNEFGKMPSSGDLINSGRSSLSGAILKYHGGFHKVINNLGFATIKDKNYWKDIDNVVSEVIELYYRYNKFLNKKELEKLGYNSLARSMSRYHDGMQSIYEKAEQIIKNGDK